MKLRLLIYPLMLLFMSNFLSAQERRIKVVKKSGNRFALVIGNSSYKHAPLVNPANDAADMANVLKKCGFEVTLKTNVNLKTMENAVRDFSNNLGPGGIGLFYFSGHGMQVNGINYLIPVDSDIRHENEIKYKSLSANFALDQMAKAGNHMNILIMDACRDNPFARSFRSSSSGLAFMNVPKGTLIVYATGPGKTAAEGKGRNGIFTKHLLTMIKESNVGIMRLLQMVRQNVMQETWEKQIPWEASSLVGDFYFNFKDTRLEKITAEISKLETQLKILEDNVKKVKTERERREAARKARELEVKLKAKKLQQERLKNEQERRERLKKQEQMMAEQEAQRRKEKERQLRLEKERLKELQEKISKEKERLNRLVAPIMTRVDAEKEVEELNKKRKEIENQLNREKEEALQKLKRDYQPTKERLYQPIPPKDQFEKTTAYNARIKKRNEEIAAIEKKYKSDAADIETRFIKEYWLRTEHFYKRTKALKARNYPVEDLKVKLLDYNADEEIYYLQLTLPNGHTWKYYLSIDPEKAGSLYRNKDLLEVEGFYATWDNYTSLCRIFIIDPNSVEIPVHYRYLTEADVNSIVKSRDFFERNRNRSGNFVNNYKETSDFVIDWSTGLMWFKGVVRKYMKYEEAQAWIKKINQDRDGGYDDWRLPTVEEAASLIEKDVNILKSGEELQIDPIFWTNRRYMWTGDFYILADKSNVKLYWPPGTQKEHLFWRIDFYHGIISRYRMSESCFVRPVRDLNEQDRKRYKKNTPTKRRR